MDNNACAKRVAESYAKYISIDNLKQMEKLEESIEETLTRMEELENGITMLQGKREKVSLCDLTSAKSNLSTICQQIHRLDELSKQVLHDVESLEPIVDEAESTLTPSTEGRIKTMLKPLFSKKSESAPEGATLPQFTPLPHFTTASIFPTQVQDQTSPL